MDVLTLLDLISGIMLFILIVLFFWRVSKLKPPQVFFLLDFVCYKSPFAKPDPEKEPENQPEVYTSPNEVENVVYEMVDELLKKTKANVKHIGVLVCMFNGSATVLISSMVLKKYKLKANVTSYDLNGKGCTSGLMAVTLAKQQLQVKPDCCALVLVTEEFPKGRHVSSSTTTDLSPTLPYRPSGAAILLSNRPSDSPHAKYILLGSHTLHLSLTPTTPPPDPTPSFHVALTLNDHDATSASEKVVRSSAAFLSSLVRGPHRHEFRLCQADGAPMVGAAERDPRVGYQAEASRVVRSQFGYEPVTSLWYGFAERETRWTRFDKGDGVSQVALWTDWSNFKGTTLVWKAIRDVDRREQKVKPMVFKIFGDINFRPYLPK